MFRNDARPNGVSMLTHIVFSAIVTGKPRGHLFGEYAELLKLESSGTYLASQLKLFSTHMGSSLIGELFRMEKDTHKQLIFLN